MRKIFLYINGFDDHNFAIGTMIWWENDLFGWLVVTRGCSISLFGAMVSRVDDVVILVILWVTDDNSCGHKRMQSSITSLEFVTYLRKIIVFYSKYQFRPAVANVSFFGEIYKVILVWDYIFKFSVYFLSIGNIFRENLQIFRVFPEHW